MSTPIIMAAFAAAPPGPATLADKQWPAARRAALRRDGHNCVFCGTAERLHVHHIRPRKRGGRHALWNLITLCVNCHGLEHAAIRRAGLCVIPGPDYEPARFALTDAAAVLAYAARLEQEGLDGRYLRACERRRMLNFARQ